ncbi:MAG: YkgJ family cysteine cluster protein [Pseudomonadota bacterium]
MDPFRLAMMGAPKKSAPAPKPKPKADTACIGCGTCCRKSGPALHAEDVPLFASQAFGRGDLVTVRAGELAFDQISGTLQPLAADIVKFGDGRVRNSHGFMVGSGEEDASQAQGLSGCRFLVEQPKTPTGEIRGACGIYAHRPIECRVLLCKDTQAIEALYAQDRLDRAGVLLATFGPDKVGYAKALVELVDVHNEVCSASSWHGLLQEIALLERAMTKAGADGSASDASQQERKTALYQDLAEAVRLDAAYRELAHEKAGVPVEELAFLFGRPLPHIALSYGVRI